MTFSDSSALVVPTFLVGGAPKAGTTSLYHYLRQHPDVCMSARKETGVFMENYDKGLEWLSETHYQHYEEETAVGEGSAGVLRLPECAERIHDAIPSVKLIFVLREPIERLYSHFSFLQSVRSIDESWSFSEFTRSDHHLRDNLIDQGFYYKHLSRFEAHFEREQMLILLFGNLRANTTTTVRRVYEFIGVDPSFESDLDVYNQTREPRFETAYHVLNSIWRKMRSYLDVYAINQTRRFREVLKSVVTQTTDREPLDSKDEAYLREIYRKPNHRLEKWLGRDLSHWR